MSPAAVLAAVGMPNARLIASVEYAPGVARCDTAAVYGQERGIDAACRVIDSLCRTLALRPAHLDAEPATDNPADPACYVLDNRPTGELARLARVIGITQDRFIDALIITHMSRRRASEATR